MVDFDEQGLSALEQQDVEAEQLEADGRLFGVEL